MPALDLTLVFCSDDSLPCMRDFLPIICSGQKAEDGRIKLPRGAAHQGNSTIPPIHIGTGGRRSQCALQLAPSRPPEHARETMRRMDPLSLAAPMRGSPGMTSDRMGKA